MKRVYFRLLKAQLSLVAKSQDEAQDIITQVRMGFVAEIWWGLDENQYELIFFMIKTYVRFW